jgi:hypothetical protein
MSVESVESVERVEQSGAESAICDVRCLAGVISPGDTFDTLTSRDGEDRLVELRLIGMWRYGQPTDMLDPPHAARVELAGPGAQALADAAFLSRAQNGMSVEQ